MPLPEPNTDEDRGEFIERCLQDDTAKDEFPEQPQRFAVCQSKWEAGIKKGESIKKPNENDITEKVTLIGTITKVDKDRMIAYGWFSVIEIKGEAVVDAHGDVILEDTLIDAAHEFMMESRAGKVMHQGRRVADIVESVVFTKDLQKALGIDLGKVGWFGAMHFRDEKVWVKVKSGELSAFSIGGVARRTEI